MSAPDTNIEKQKRRHKGPLIGLVVAILALGLIFGYSTLIGNDAQAVDPAPAAPVAN